MYVRRKNKSLYIVLIMVVLIGVSIGYAALNTTLNINGRSNISKNTWDVYFDNIVVKNGSVEAIKIPTISDKTNINFEVNLNLPGDFYEFTFDVVNNGSIEAMIDSVNKTPNLKIEQQKYLDYIISYQNGEQISTKQLVKANEFVRLKVRVEYKKDINASDLPQSTETLNLGFILNYVQSDGTGSAVTDNGVWVIKANGSLDAIGTIVTIGDQQFYTIGTEGENVKLLSMYNLYVGNSVDEDYIATPLESPTGKQNQNARGWFDGASVWYGTTAVSSYTQKGTNYSDYSGSIVEGYVNAYKNILEGEEYGIDVIEARLISYDELTDSKTFSCKEHDYCSDKYPWIYSTSFWSGSAYNFNSVWSLASDGYLTYYTYNRNFNFGVRPVIIISKSYF